MNHHHGGAYIANQPGGSPNARFRVNNSQSAQRLSKSKMMKQAKDIDTRGNSLLRII